MKVSIIIPCYNSARYLDACLTSLLAQTMPDFEAILVDDGSKDDTLAIAQRWAQQDRRVIALHQENAGVSAARNLGLDCARGEWITFVDSDDLLPCDALETMLSGASDGVDMVVCPHETFTEDGKRETVIPQTRWMDKRGEAQRRAAALRLIEGDSVLNIMCCKLHRRELIEREGLRLNPSVRIAEDALFNLEAVLCGRGIAYVPHIAYSYRTHEASAMHTQTGGEYARHLPWMTAMRELLIRRGAMEAYYGAYLDAVVLRLYKDGGLAGAIREFNAKGKALASIEGLDGERMRFCDRLSHGLVSCGLYPAAYGFVYPVQLIRRKLGEAAFALRTQKEKSV